MQRTEQMFNAISEANNKYKGRRTGYDMRCTEMVVLAKTFHTQPFEGITQAFDYGFVKGIRFAKATYKKGERL